MSDSWKDYAGWLPEFGNNPDTPLNHVDMLMVMECFYLVTGAPRLSVSELFDANPNNHVSAWLDAFIDAWDEVTV